MNGEGVKDNKSAVCPSAYIPAAFYDSPNIISETDGLQKHTATDRSPDTSTLDGGA